jgi:pimeloyl-ACP methyl ester carboxylesterase
MLGAGTEEDLAVIPALVLGLHLHACVEGRSRVAASCGTFGVYENRAAASGRIIALRVVVLKAEHPSGKAIDLIAGGPGESAANFAPDIADAEVEQALAKLRDSYDIVLLDERGTGKSNPSGCGLTLRSQPVTYFAQLFPTRLLAECRRRYLTHASLNYYNTANAVDDLDDLRAALGYSKVVLDGGSYGTYTSFVYMRRHPDRVESAVLSSVSPPHFNPLPGEPAGAQAALDDLIVKCRRDVRCNARFPAFGPHFYALLARFKDGSLPVKLPDARTGGTQTLALSKEVFVDTVRHVLYDPYVASYLPYAVEQAYRGDTIPLARVMNLTILGLAEELDEGTFLSYSCAEQTPFLTEARIEAAAANSYAGDLRIRAQQRACAIWNVTAMPPADNAVVRSSVPIFMVSGSDDPGTPARYATEALPYFPNARQLIVRGAAHTPETPCIDALTVQFVRAQSARNLDLDKCAAVPFVSPEFKTSTAGLPESP